MKKIYLLAGTFAFSAALLAQNSATHVAQESTSSIRKMQNADRAAGDIIWEEEFNDLSAWTIDNGAQGEWLNIIDHTEDLNTDGTPDFYQYVAEPTFTTASNGMMSFNGIRYLLLQTAQYQDANVVMDSSLDCSGINAISISFEQAYRAFNYDEQYVEVSNDGGVTWPGSYLINDQYTTNGPGVVETVSINITAEAANQADVRIRFRWESSGGTAPNSGYGWAFDDLKVFETENNNNELVASYMTSGTQQLDYHMVPTSQVSTISFSGERCNVGGLAQPNAKLNVSITGNETFSSTSTPGSLGVQACDSVATIDDFTPNGTLGTYTVDFYVDSDSTENATDNDTLTKTLEVTEYIFGRDDNNILGSIGNVTGGSQVSGDPMKIGNVMDINADMTVYKANVRIANSTENLFVDQDIFVEIEKYNGTEYEYFAASSEYTIQQGDAGGFVTLVFEDPVELLAGDDILVMVGHNGGVDLNNDGNTDEVRFGTAQSTYTGSVLGYTSEGLFQLTDPSAIMIRLNSNPDAEQSIEENNSSLSSTSVYPNPASDEATINFSLTESAKVSIEIVDYTGKVIANNNLGNVAAGESQFNVNTSELANGVYFYNITVDGDVITKKLVVSKK